MLGILTESHPLFGRIPGNLREPVFEGCPDGAIWGVGYEDLAWKAAREAPHGIVNPFLWARLPGWLRHQLMRKGARPGIGGGGLSDGYRALGALFAITSTIHIHQKLLSAIAAGQQPPMFTFRETSFDGTSGIATETIEGSTEASAGTAGTAPTVTQIRGYPPVVQATTITGNFSAEGTAYVATSSLLLPLPTAPFVIQYPLGREIMGNPTASAVMRAILLRGSTTVNCNMRSMIEFEE